MTSLYKFRSFLNTIDCSDARDSSVSGYIDLFEGNDYCRPNLVGELKVRDCGGSISLDFKYYHRLQIEEDDRRGEIGYEDSIQKFDLLISYIEQMKKAYIEGKKHVDDLTIEWEKKKKEKNKEKQKENIVEIMKSDEENKLYD